MSMMMALSTFSVIPVKAADVDHLLINQIYGTGGKTGCAVSHNFIELYNPTESDIDLAEYKVIYNNNELDIND